MNPHIKHFVIGLAIAMLIAVTMPVALAEEDFSVKEYNEFHDVLRPQASFSEVHESFEMLAGMLPRK